MIQSIPAQALVLKSKVFLYCLFTAHSTSLMFLLCFHLTEPPPVLRPAVNATSSVGGVAVLSCQVEGAMRHKLTWHRAGRIIQAPAGRVKLLSNSSLQISEVQTQDAGEYNCVATNAHGHSRITVWLLVPGTLGQYPAGHLL